MAKKRISSSTLLVLLLLGGLALLLYPTVSNWWNNLHQTRAIIDYTTALSKMTSADYSAELAAAEDYNQKIRENADIGVQPDDYANVLNTADTGMMGIITIESIDVQIPIYHGTSDGVLTSAVGHLEGSSLPIGGKSTHCVLAGHRGLPGAKLFTELDQLKVGDTFMLSILGRDLVYMVDQILTVKPQQTDALQIQMGQDLCTLVTCTPYGINSHRLLVRGHRIESVGKAATVSQSTVPDGKKTSSLGMPVLITVILLLALLIIRLRHRKN